MFSTSVHQCCKRDSCRFRLSRITPSVPKKFELRNSRRQAARIFAGTALPLTNILQQCIAAHFLTEELGPVPEVVADAWGHACAARLQEVYQPVSLPFWDPASGGTASCQLTLVGVFHRDATNLRLVRDAIVDDALTTPDAVAVEARHSFLPSYMHLSQSLPDELVCKLSEAPLHGLQEARDYVSLEDRLAWHEVLLVANDQLHQQQQQQQPWELPTLTPAHNPTPCNTAAGTASASAAAAAGPTAAPPPRLSPSSALSPAKVVSAFLAVPGGELVLSEKVAAVLAAEERGVPLYGIELDEAAAYAGLMTGPLTPGAAAGLSGGGGRDGGSGGIPPGVAAQLEVEQLRLALAALEPRVSAAFRDWFRRVPTGDLSRVLQQQLAGLLPKVMDPVSYLSYVDETEAVWSDERRVGRAAAAQHEQLSVRREQHFLEQLRRLAASGGTDGGPCGRLVVVLGRAHAARLRRTLLAAQGPPPPLRC